MDRLLAEYERKRHDDKVNGSEILCKSFALSSVQTASIPRPLTESHQSVALMFYLPGDDDYLLNRVVAKATEEKVYDTHGNRHAVHFAHVELAFSHDLCGNLFQTEPAGQMMAFSITQNSNLYFRFKSFRQQYQKMSITIPESKYKLMFAECQRLSLLCIGFDYLGMYASRLVPDAILQPRRPETHGTFCSRIITEILQQFQIGNDRFRAQKPWRATPNKLAVSFPEASVG